MTTAARRTLAVLLAAFAAYCYLSHLSGALGFGSDENRAYHFQLLTPLPYFVYRPFIRFFGSLDAPYYIQGVVGLLSIPLTVWIVRRTVSSSAAWIAAVFLVFYDFPLAYAKMLYYTNFHYFLAAASVAVYLEALRRDRWFLYLGAGLLVGAMVVVNASGVIAMALVIAFCLAAHALKIFDRPKTSLTIAAAAMGAGAALAYVLFEGWLMIWYAAHPALDRISYFGSSVSYGKETPLFYQLGPEYAASQIFAMVKQSLSPFEGGWFRGAFILTATLGGICLALKRRDPRLIIWGVLLLSGLAAVVLLTCLKVQPFFPRTLAWTILPVAALTAYVVEAAWKQSRGILRVAVYAVLAVYVFFGVQKCLAVTHATYSVNPILRHLENQGIDQSRVATIFPINRFKDFKTDHGTAELPILINKNPAAVAQGKSHILHWPLIYAAYREGRIRYVLTSGIGGILHRVGEQDPVLALVSPKAEWSHPFSNRHLNADNVFTRIRLYDLQDVFDRPAAVDYVKWMDQKIQSLTRG